MFNFQVNPKKVHWDNDDNYIFMNPSLSHEEQRMVKINAMPEDLQGMIWVASSGTTETQSVKLIGLKKQAFLNSAKSVCQHLQVSESDVWYNVLPRFHVAGLSVEARSYVSGCKINLECATTFDAHNFVKNLAAYGVTISSLVPTQVYELVQNKLPPPKSLRFIYVGGADLSESLYQSAVSLGWPIVLTYGMTEASSSVAASQLDDLLAKDKPDLVLLSHMQASLAKDLTLELSGNSIATAQIQFFADRTPELHYFEGKLLTQDMVNLQGTKLRFIARKNQQVKVSGELVNLNHTNQLFNEFKRRHGVVVSTQITSSFHPKYGQQVELIVYNKDSILKINTLVERFNQSMPSFQTIRAIVYQDKSSSQFIKS